MKLLDIAVTGAGVGGLALASLLVREGHRVTLFERFEQPRPLGSGLTIQPVGQAVLDELGVGAEARALGAPIRSMIGHAGRRVALNVAYPSGAPGLGIHRATLFELLWQAMQASGVRLDTGVEVSAAPALPNGRRRLMDKDGEDLGAFDLVVDASGVGSRLSPLKARPLAFGAVWGNVPWPKDSAFAPDMLRQRYFRANRMAGIMPVGRMPAALQDGTEGPQIAAVFWSLSPDEMAAWPDQDFAAWKAGVADFWPDMTPFLTGLDSGSDMTTALYSHGTLRRPWAEGMAFIGDAAHRASPQLGQGANMALLDALALSMALARHPLDEALPEYARMRRWHIRLYQLFSAALTPAYQSHGRVLPVVRDLVLAPSAQIWPFTRLLSSLVAGTLIPPLASTRWPGP